ncbi:KRAB domain-containing zinc finger protein [Cryptococcus neoformans c8]|nr:KRAB domain-containing zinc finger protein [Cryptococcus neoformans var. grubii AD1-83a]OXG31286.1 KRAB domain-containing zinc finger protein [Cryptococcus neoformans var. grubii Bt15]OXG41950.1 KRAB domain-containing zinc finger protein [Cryptococcus neoformans var. grubii Bt120]OXG65466.1 KRAB domain-containing zinc finger protein [Cryptococcus neoformans var. grubii MW-RSA1955]OXG69695.1 KRAB domain-containing zinc finger protein [Cryptococcus neoformans var. grubii c8]OXG74069.1 KRAB do
MPPVSTSQYVCGADRCGKSFSSSSHLRRHERTHLGTRPYACKQCGKTFVRKEVCQRHEGLHSGLSPERPASILASPGRSSQPPITSTTKSSTALSNEIRQSLPSHDTSASVEPSQPPISVGNQISSGNIAPLAFNSLPLVSEATRVSQNVNIPDLMQSPPQSDEALDLRSWLGQDTNLLFDEQVYGWLEQVLTEQNGTQGLQMSTGFDTYFPPINTVLTPTDGSNNPRHPTIGDDVKAKLTQIWQGMSFVKGVPIAENFNIAQLFAAGWRVILTRFPIVHTASFDISTTPPSFLSSVIALGAVHSTQEIDRAFARQLLPVIRAMAVSESLDDSKSRLQTIQAFLLSAITGEHLNTHEQHQAQGMVSHAMSLMRRFGYLLMTGSGENENNSDQDTQWRTWAEQESRRRTLWLCWMLDIRSVTLGHHFGSRARSPFRMIIELPCRQDCWSASNSFAWARRLHTAQTIPQALQSTLTKDWSREWFADEQLDFARLVVIHALAALAWDLAHRDLILPPELSSEGPSKIAVSLVCGMQSLSKHPSLVNENPIETVTPLTAEAYDISTAACLDIFTDLTSLEIFCGVSAAGMIQNVKTSDRLEANGKMRSWSRTSKAAQAVLVAADFLKQSIEMAEKRLSQLDRLFRIPGTMGV